MVHIGMDKQPFRILYILCLSFQLCQAQALTRHARLMQANQKTFIWNRTMEDFTNPNGQSISEFHLIAGNASTYSLENVTVRVLADNMEPYIITSSNSSNNISGFLGDFWYILEEFLKFKSNITHIYDFDHGLIMISKNEGDVYLAAAVHYNGLTGISFSQPYFLTWYHVYYKVPEGKPTLYVHFSVFSVILWLHLTALYLVLTLTLWLTCSILKTVSKEGEIRLSLVTYFLGVISAFFNTGYDLRLRSYSARIQIFVALVFGTLCYYTLSATLVARLAVLDRPMLFKTLEEVAEKRTHFMCVRNVSFVYKNFTDKHRIILPKWQGILNTNACPNMFEPKEISSSICNNNMVAFENRIVMSRILYNDRVSCDVTHLPKRYFRSGNYISFSQKFKGIQALKAAMIKMRSSGILFKLEKKWIMNKRGKPSLAGGNQITFLHIQGLIFIYMKLIAFSLVFLILEIFNKKYSIVIKNVFKKKCNMGLRRSRKQCMSYRN